MLADAGLHVAELLVRAVLEALLLRVGLVLDALDAVGHAAPDEVHLAAAVLLDCVLVRDHMVFALRDSVQSAAFGGMLLLHQLAADLLRALQVQLQCFLRGA